MQYHIFSSQSFDEVISNKDLDLTQRQIIISSMLRISINNLEKILRILSNEFL